MKVGVLFSSGKDSTYAAYLIKKKHEVICLISIKSKNLDSFMYHTPNIDLVNLQAESMGLPLVEKETKGEKEIELEDLEKALIVAKEKFNIEGVVTGALFSEYQKSRIDKICKKLNLECLNPLWYKDQEKHMRDLVKNKFEIIFSAIAADGLDKSWLGRVITNSDIDKLVELNKKNGLNIAGEGGEFESLVLDCPLFNKKLEIVDREIVEESKHVVRMDIKKVKLV